MMKDSRRVNSRRIRPVRLRFRSLLAHIRHFRGRGVHSPYIYSLVREAFLCKVFLSGDRTLYDRLREEKIPHRHALDIANMVIYCGMSVDPKSLFQSVDYQVFSVDSKDDALLSAVANARELGTTIVVLLPNSSPERREMCDKIIADHHSTTVEKRSYLIIFNNHLPKQHFEL